VETKVKRDSVEYAVVGIGLNVNESLNELPEELHNTATTLSAEKGSPLQRELVVAWILNALERWIDAVKSGKSVSLRSAWLEKCDHLNKTVAFTNNGENRSGTFSGVGENGAALIKTSDDEISLTGEEISINV
jgi:BirA family biotin operon repressor/biotin-[acetyl-CoA-carboxylase] ligase